MRIRTRWLRTQRLHIQAVPALTLLQALLPEIIATAGLDGWCDQIRAWRYTSKGGVGASTRGALLLHAIEIEDVFRPSHAFGPKNKVACAPKPVVHPFRHKNRTLTPLEELLNSTNR
jgi:hypothetical protein